MSRSTIKAVALAAALAIASPASATVSLFGASLTGAEEVPPNASPATGSVLVAYDDVLHTLSVTGSFSDLLAPAFGAHIHCCTPPGANAAVAVGMTGFPAATSGAFANVFDLTLTSTYSGSFLTASGGTAAGAEAALFAAMLGGTTYFNIHTSVYPGGEIRGQLAYIPEPGTWALMIAGFGLTGFALRRRRRSPALA